MHTVTVCRVLFVAAPHRRAEFRRNVHKNLHRWAQAGTGGDRLAQAGTGAVCHKLWWHAIELSNFTPRGTCMLGHAGEQTNEVICWRHL